MSIKTVSLGKMGGGGEGWVFQPVERTRYLLPKGDYTFLLVKGRDNVYRQIGLTPSVGNADSASGNLLVAKAGIEWVEFTGDIWRAAIVPGVVQDKAPKSTASSTVPNIVASRGEFELGVLYKEGDTVEVSDQGSSFNGIYECRETHKSSFYYYPWNSVRYWKKLS
ncbi:hypothetical protein CIP107532_00570 [Corynebacterium diphtheriae]|uniref:hypothetical protein n=1 Tax=Corynebacterium diphtheriae TaxID=1717 RepID=UPI000A1E423E|nr:hypothetical protein [Corynebacterium diphtheriae]OSQ22079.1 hypothetical protein B1A52_00335 [Corynebacterium diphtheriae]CAB0550121.1 hypothetical protein CIP107532_00570 [Corynebacterium diphtheriae]